MNQNPLSEAQPSISPEQSEPQSSTPTPALTNWSKTLLLIVLSLIIIAGAIYGGFYIGRKQISNEEITNAQEIEISNQAIPATPISATDLTENWETYKNNQYGFEFKYPKGSTLKTSQTGYVRIQNYISDDSPGLKGGEFYLEFNLPPSTTSCKNEVIESEITKKENGTIYKGIGQLGGDSGGKRFALCAEKLDMNLYLQITENNEDGIIANQILSTFKFTNEVSKSNEIVNWTTYSDKIYGYQIMYPPEWNIKETPSLGYGGVAQIYSESLSNNFKIEIGKHLESIKEGQSPKEYRREKTDEEFGEPIIEEEKEYILGDNKIYRVISKASGHWKYIIYYYIPIEDSMYFAAGYTSNPEQHSDLFDQVIGDRSKTVTFFT